MKVYDASSCTHYIRLFDTRGRKGNLSKSICDVQTTAFLDQDVRICVKAWESER